MILIGCRSVSGLWAVVALSAFLFSPCTAISGQYSISVEACTPGTRLARPVSALGEPVCADLSDVEILPVVGSPTTVTEWADFPNVLDGRNGPFNGNSDQLWRFSHTIRTPVPTSQAYIIRLALGKRDINPPMPTLLDGPPVSVAARAVGVCLRASEVNRALNLVPNNFDTITAAGQQPLGMNGFCQVERDPMAATTNPNNLNAAVVADGGNRDPPSQAIRLDTSNFGLQMKRLAVGNRELGGHLCPAGDGAFRSLTRDDAIAGRLVGNQGSDSALLSFADVTRLTPSDRACDQLADVGLLAGADFPEVQVIGFTVTCDSASAGVTAFGVFTFIGTYTHDIPFVSGTGTDLNPWAPYTTTSLSANPSIPPFAVAVVNLKCAGAEPDPGPPGGLYRGPSNASSFCGTSSCPTVRTLTSFILGVTYDATCVSCACQPVATTSGPTLACSRGRDAAAAEGDDYDDTGSSEADVGDQGRDAHPVIVDAQAQHLDDVATRSSRAHSRRGSVAGHDETPSLGSLSRPPLLARRATFRVLGCDSRPDRGACCAAAFRELVCDYGFELEVCFCNLVGQVDCPSHVTACPSSKKGFLGLLGILGILPIFGALCALVTCWMVVRSSPRKRLPPEPFGAIVTPASGVGAVIHPSFSPEGRPSLSPLSPMSPMSPGNLTANSVVYL